MVVSTYSRRVCLAALALSWAAGPSLAAPRRPAARADRVVVVKSERRLYLLRAGRIEKTYRVALGRVPRGAKRHAGDGRTPEGQYHFQGINLDSRFYRAIRVSYPNATDRARAQAMNVAAGGQIMLHGLPNERPGWGEEHWMYNWTDGCIAVTNAEMDEILQSVTTGTPIEIRP